MATLSANNLTIADVTRTIDPKGDAAVIAEVLNKRRSFVQDVQWKAGNLHQGNRTTQRTSLPTVSAAIANQGTTPGKTTSVQIDDACAVFRTVSVIDKIVAEFAGQLAANRANEAKGHIEALGQKLETTFFYGSPSVPEEFTGLANRYNSLSGTMADNVITGGGVGADNTSVWFVQHGEGMVMGIYPTGTSGGLQLLDEGLTTIVDTAGVGGAVFPGYRAYYTWFCGLAVEDWRSVVRIPNIDISALVTKASAADLSEKMIAAIEAVPNPEMGGVFYMNRTVRKMLGIQQRDDVGTGGGLTYENVDGKRVLMFQGFPVRISDELVNNEALVA